MMASCLESDRKVGVGIPTYQRQDQLATLLESIPRRIPVWVSDNGATLADDFIAAHPNVAFTRRVPPIPMFANWNSAARLVESEWVAIPSDDDLYYEGAFDVIESVAETYPWADILIFGHHLVDEHYRVLTSWCPDTLKVIRAPGGFEDFRFGVHARMPSVFFRRALLHDLGFFDEHFVLTAADSDLVQRALLRGTSVFVPKIVSGYRTWTSGLTHQKLASAQWMEEVDCWAGKIEGELALHARYRASASKIRDSLYAQNLLAGISQLERQNRVAEAWSHFQRSRYPSRAHPRLQFAIFYRLVKPLLRPLRVLAKPKNNEPVD